MRERRVAAALFFVTCASVFLVYLISWERAALTDVDAPLRAALFAACLMGILLSHELGHYVVALQHGFRLSLPWFLPAPIWVGTFGAIIRLRDLPRHRTGLLEMGAAGPLAGLVVVVGMMSARLWVGGPLEVGSQPELELQAPLLWRGLSWLLTGDQQPVVTTDPVAFAAWIGCLVTSLNLVPFGQLDGGHVVAALTPTHARKLGFVTASALVLGGLVWVGWPVWAVLLYLIGTSSPCEVRSPSAPLTPRARAAAWACALAFVLCFMPRPIG